MATQAEELVTPGLRLRLPAGTGQATVVAVVAGVALAWILARPADQPDARYAGEILGVEALTLFACTLVLVTVLPIVEQAFGGLDRAVQWHRGAAVAGLLLLVPHDALASSTVDRYVTPVGSGLGSVSLAGLLLLGLWALAPRLRAARWPGPVRWLSRITYQRWLTGHRLIGLFVITAVAHAAIVDPALRHSTFLLVVYVVIGAIAIGAYLYRELFARFVIPVYDYSVATVERPTDSTLVVALEPARKPLRFRAGQFVFLAFGGPGGWERHPFSVSSAPSAQRLEASIKASGDYTSELYDELRPNTPARVAGPFGAFDYHPGGKRQLWIAGGIGITPFASWIRALDGTFDRDVDLYYSVAHRSDAVYLDELEAAAAAHPSLRVHLVDTSRDGMLTAPAMIDGGPSPWVYMCGPPRMMSALEQEFRSLGIPRKQIRYEEFAVR